MRSRGYPHLPLEQQQHHHQHVKIDICTRAIFQNNFSIVLKSFYPFIYYCPKENSDTCLFSPYPNNHGKPSENDKQPMYAAFGQHNILSTFEKGSPQHHLHFKYIHMP